ncbi:sporulation integral membrane protein YlbJ [Natronincola peptidivorans]|uniref:Sporulation integral membrane protein YlbJ n=1 Tax=Natronincola peptidivorans TaxID=426128 RepID=A0A1H9YC13_9FIRM|nr:sporulation integral membrane protein YlbJ [Natronincola peptidivorans]SES66490.1 sporulation integral membrane protein YlbJ [Natronincola peptidivorans]
MLFRFVLLFLVGMVAIICFLNKKNFRRFQKYFPHFLLILIVLLLVICIILFPSESVKAAHNGLNIWLSVVLPALLPFFIGSELLVGLGVVKFVGTLLEPIMRPLFNVPGEGSFAFAMSVTSGYPVGVKIATGLRAHKMISKIEAQRLVAFCSTSGPLFLIGAVSIGMFKSSEIGILLALSHYLSAVIVGILFRFYKRSDTETVLSSKKNYNNGIIKRAFLHLRASKKTNTSFGILLGNAVKESINTMLMIGGFIILFSVIINILEIIGLITFVSNIIFILLKPFSIDFAIIKALLTGLFEITIGCKLAADTISASLINRIAAAAFIIGWSGFSIHAQSISILSTTDINPYVYIFSKLLHGLFSYILILLIYPIFTLYFTITSPTFHNYGESYWWGDFFNSFKLSMELFVIILISLLSFSLLFGFFIFVKNVFQKHKTNRL